VCQILSNIFAAPR